MLQAAFKRDYSHDQTANELERLATATNRWQELLDEYTNRVNELEREDRGSAADLWVKIGRWYAEHLSHLEYAIHSVQQALRIDPSHTGALGGMARAAAQARLVERADRDAAAPRGGRDRTREEDRAVHPARGAPRAPDAGRRRRDPRLPAGARPRRRPSHDALTALDRLYRRTEQWEPLIDVLTRRAELRAGRARTSSSSASRSAQIWDLRLFDARPGDHRVPEGPRHRSVEPQRAARARAALREDQPDREVPRGPRGAARRVAVGCRARRRCTSAWPRPGRSGSASSTAPPRRSRRSSRSTTATTRVPRAGAPVPAGRQVGSARRDLSQPHHGDVRRAARASTSTSRWARSTRCSCSDVDRAIEAYNDVLSFDADEPRALDALGRLYEKISEWDRAIDVMAHLVAADRRRAQAGRPVLAHGPDPVHAARRRGCRGGNLLRGLAIDPGHVPTMEALTKQYSDRGDWLKAAQMMVRAESYTPVAIDKVRLLFEAGEDLRGQAAPGRAAKQLYAAVISLDPEHVEAGRPLAEPVLRGAAVGRAVAGDRHARAARSASCTPIRASSTSSTTAPRRPPTSSATSRRRSATTRPRTTSTRRTCRR